MGLRSNFPRLHKDAYLTIDKRAVVPLIPHLPRGVRYAEPCAGEGHLIELLRPYASLAWASDIQPSSAPHIHENDALAVSRGDAEMFITNPPWTRTLLHPLIVHLSDQAPFWALFDSAWANTAQARPFMPRLRRIVSVGRLIWMPGTKMAGKDDVSWYLFDRPLAGSAPLFYGRGCSPPETRRRTSRTCVDCGVLIDRFGKWRLQQRNGVASPVHRNCAQPSGPPAGPADTPLLDWIGGPHVGG